MNMTRYTDHQPLDLLAIERDARAAQGVAFRLFLRRLFGRRPTAQGGALKELHGAS